MVNVDTLHSFLKIKESYQLPGALMTTLLDKNLKNQFLELISRDQDLATDPLRDYFQENHSNREAMMQDYTPDCLCRLVSRLEPCRLNILDLCAGTGSLTLFTANQNTWVQCEELSTRVLPVLLMNLALRNFQGFVLNKDVVSNNTEKAFKITSGDRFSDIEVCLEPAQDKFELIVSNPPYSLKWPGQKDLRLEGWDTPPKSKADYLFILDALGRLSENGTAIFILPHGVLFRGAAEGKIRKQLIEKNLIHTVIGLPDNMFMNTGIPVCLVVLKKNKQDSNVLFIDASKSFSKRGKVNVMEEEYISEVVHAYQERKSVDKFSSVVTLEKIRENDYNLNIPRYVDTYDYVPPPNLIEVTNELMQIDQEIAEAQLKIAEGLSNLQGNAHGINYPQDIAHVIDYLRGHRR